MSVWLNKLRKPPRTAPAFADPVDDPHALEGKDGEPADLVMMGSRSIYVKENVGEVKVEVLRLGECDTTASVRYRVRHEKASPSDLRPMKERNLVLTFAPGETRKTISVGIRDDKFFELVEEFAIELVVAWPASAA